MTAFHVTCGFKHGLEMKTILDDSATDGVRHIVSNKSHFSRSLPLIHLALHSRRHLVFTLNFSLCPRKSSNFVFFPFCLFRVIVQNTAIEESHPPRKPRKKAVKNPLHLKMQKTYVKRSEYDHVIKTHLFCFSIFIMTWSAIRHSDSSASNLCLSLC